MEPPAGPQAISRKAICLLVFGIVSILLSADDGYAGVHSDPHMVTADDLWYKFNGIGEYFMVQTLDDSYTLQIRTSRARSYTGQPIKASICTAIVAKTKRGERIQVELNEHKDGLVLTVGNDVQTEFMSSNYRDVSIDEVVIQKTSTKQLILSFDEGWIVNVTETGAMLNIITHTPNEAYGLTRGLEGVANNDQSDDFTTPDGTVLSPDMTTEQIHHEFGQKWQVNADTSLFKYPTGMTFADFADPLFEPHFELACPDNGTLEAANRLCGDSEFCKFDFCATLDPKVGIIAKAYEEAYRVPYKIIVEKPEIVINVGSGTSALGKRISALMMAVCWMLNVFA